MEQTTAHMVEVESITELTEGDMVTVRGNGHDVMSEVSVIEHDSFKNKMTATLEPADNYTVTLTDNDHPLQADGISANVGSVTVFRHK